MKNRRSSSPGHVLFVLTLLLALVCAASMSAQPSYKIERTISLPGNDGWDYLSIDEENDRAYVAHGTMVQIVDLLKGQVLATITGTHGVHGIALASDVHKAFISCGSDNLVMVVDMQTLKTVSSISIKGKEPDAIVYDVFSHRVFCFNGRSASATVIDAKTMTVIDDIALEGKPEAAVPDGRGSLFVNIEDKSTICEINTTSLRVEKTWSLAPGEYPTGLTIDPFNQRLFATCSNRLMIVMDARNGRILKRLEIGDRTDGAAFDAVLGRVYSSNGDGTLTVVDAADAQSFSVLENVVTKRGARTLAVHSKTHHIYLPTADFLPPPPASAEHPRPRPQIKPDSFILLDIVATK